MTQELLKKKFIRTLEAFMSENRLNEASCGWVLECCSKTIKNWLEGKTLPGRNNAIVLMYFDSRFRDVFNMLVGAPAKKERLRDRVKREKAAA